MRAVPRTFLPTAATARRLVAHQPGRRPALQADDAPEARAGRPEVYIARVLTKRVHFACFARFCSLRTKTS
jgi:hypothetical protein